VDMGWSQKPAVSTITVNAHCPLYL